MTDIQLPFKRTAKFRGNDDVYAAAVHEAAGKIAPAKGRISVELKAEFDNLGLRQSDVEKAYRAEHTQGQGVLSVRLKRRKGGQRPIVRVVL